MVEAAQILMLFFFSPLYCSKGEEHEPTNGIEESKLITLIRLYGSSNGSLLRVNEILSVYEQHFGVRLSLPKPLTATIKKANYKNILVIRPDRLGPFFITLVREDTESKGRGKKSTNSCASDTQMQPRDKEQITTTLRVKRTLGKRKHGTVEDPKVLSNTLSARPVALDCTINTVNPSPVLHTKTTGLSNWDLEFENRKLQLELDNHAMALFQMKPSDNDETGKEILKLMKLKTLKRLQQELAMDPNMDSSVALEQYTKVERSHNNSNGRKTSQMGAKSSDPDTNTPKGDGISKIFHSHYASRMTSSNARSTHSKDQRQLYDNQSLWSSLPSIYTNMLIECIKNSVRRWVKEESKRGIKIMSKYLFCWLLPWASCPK